MSSLLGGHLRPKTVHSFFHCFIVLLLQLNGENMVCFHYIFDIFNYMTIENIIEVIIKACLILFSCSFPRRLDGNNLTGLPYNVFSGLDFLQTL